jgi:hypothetical protein
LNTDIRLAVDFWDHPKTLKLERRLGLSAVKSLQLLWMWARQNRTDGILSRMDREDIEIAARWTGKPDVLMESLVDLRWIDKNADTYILHDWQEHNAWAAKEEERSDIARLNRLGKIDQDLYKQLKGQGINRLSKQDYFSLTSSRPSFNVRSTSVQRPFNHTSTKGNQLLTPAPAPAPAPKEKEHTHPPTPQKVNGAVAPGSVCVADYVGWKITKENPRNPTAYRKKLLDLAKKNELDMSDYEENYFEPAEEGNYFDG